MSFCLFVDDQYQDTKHLHLVAEELKQVELYIKTKGKEGVGRLVITVPPRHGKTLTVSKRWPAYLLGRDQNLRIAVVSYGSDLSEDASRSVRALIRDEPRYRQLYPETHMRDDSQAVQRWSLAGRSPDDPSFVAVGVGGPLTGRGFHLIIVDDPLKGRAEAESEAMRNALHSWYKGTLRTRLEPGGAIVIIQTRWHENDLVGYLLDQEKTGEGESWRIVNLPALAENKAPDGKTKKDLLGRKTGAALWPQRFNRAILLQTKLAVGSYDWESQFQGHPKPPAGSKILREWLQVIQPEALPKTALQWVRYWDLAISTKEGSSYTASARLAFDEDGNLYISGMIRGRWEWPQQRKVLRTTMLAERPLGVVHGVESALHGAAAVQEFRRDKELRGIALKAVNVTADKLTRSLPWIALAEAGKVYMVAGAWVPDFMDEAAAFTGKNDQYDDQIDTVSGGVALLAKYNDKLAVGKNPFYKN